MPKRNYEDILLDSIIEDVMTDADLIAADAGGPADAKRPTSREVLNLWGRTDPAVRYEDLVVRLLSGGVPPEEAQQFILVQQYPETLEAFVAPKDAAQADALARLALYPFRPGVYGHLDPEERAQYAESVDREWQKSLAAMQPEPATPVAPQPAPMAPAEPSMPADPLAMLGG